MNWGEFFDMGGYAFYVWTSWSLAFLLLLWLYLSAKRRNRQIKREIKRQIAREEKYASSSEQSN